MTGPPWLPRCRFQDRHLEKEASRRSVPRVTALAGREAAVQAGRWRQRLLGRLPQELEQFVDAFDGCGLPDRESIAV